MVGIEFAVDLFRQQLHRNGNIRNAGIPEHGFYVIDLPDGIAQRGNVLRRHILYDHKRKSALVKIFQQLVLPAHRINIRGQIIEHIVIDACRRHAQRRWDYQQNGDDQDGNAVLYDRL